MVPLGRIGTPTDIAHTVSFLANENSSYVTGAVIHVNGGLYPAEVDYMTLKIDISNHGFYSKIPQLLNLCRYNTSREQEKAIEKIKSSIRKFPRTLCSSRRHKVPAKHLLWPI